MECDKTSNSLMKLLLFALLTCTTLVGQSREEWIRKYGKPIAESFLVRPGISATISYGPNGRATELLISPRNPALIKSRANTLSQDSVKAIIDELVPRSKRGKYLIGEFDNITCLPENDCGDTSEHYQKLTIYYNAGQEESVMPWSIGKSD